MTSRIRKALALAALLTLTLLVTTSAGYANPALPTYEVTITNLTPGQPLTPPLIATHRSSADLFTVGQAASFELKEIAENGNLGPMMDALDSDWRVFDFTAAGAPLVIPATPYAPTSFDDSVTLTIQAGRVSDYLSYVSMLICTNDGFTGLDSVHLPAEVGESMTFYTASYDAGTEINTEDFADLVPPCPVLTGVPSNDAGTGMSNPALAQGGVISHHPGIQGIADLIPRVHDWTDPVAKVEITRID